MMYREFATTTTKACTDLPAKCYESFHTAWHSATHKYSLDSLLSHLQILYNPMRNADDVMCLAICFFIFAHLPQVLQILSVYETVTIDGDCEDAES